MSPSPPVSGEAVPASGRLGSRPAPLDVLRLGEVAYDDALALQRRLLEERRLGLRPDTLVLLSHPPVVTVGRGGGAQHVLLSAEQLAARGIELRETDRGGDVTFHGPGQVVGYAILDLGVHGRDLHRFLRRMEEAVLRALAHVGVEGRREPGLTGVWAGDRKVCAIGIKVSRWISMHGFALNVATDLSFFDVIVPCGIADRGVTSLTELLGRPVERREVEDALAAAFAAEFALEWRDVGLDRPPAASDDPRIAGVVPHGDGTIGAVA
jgi:lipoate-protein ligase B